MGQGGSRKGHEVTGATLAKGAGTSGGSVATFASAPPRLHGSPAFDSPSIENLTESKGTHTASVCDSTMACSFTRRRGGAVEDEHKMPAHTRATGARNLPW